MKEILDKELLIPGYYLKKYTKVKVVDVNTTYIVQILNAKDLALTPINKATQTIHIENGLDAFMDFLRAYMDTIANFTLKAYDVREKAVKATHMKLLEETGVKIDDNIPVKIKTEEEVNE